MSLGAGETAQTVLGSGKYYLTQSLYTPHSLLFLLLLPGVVVDMPDTDSVGGTL